MSQQQEQQQNILLELSRILFSNSGDLDAFWMMLARLAADHFEADLISIWTVSNDNHNEINHCVCEYIKKESTYTDLKQVDYDFATARYPRYMATLKRERVVAIDDCRNDPRSSELLEQFFIPANTFSMLDSTIRTQKGYVGHISIEHNHQHHSWTENEKFFASSLADQASLAILENQRSRLNKEKDQQLQRIQQQQKAIAELSKSQNSIDGKLDTIANKICQLIAEVLHAQIITVYMYCPEKELYTSVYGIDCNTDIHCNNKLIPEYSPRHYPIFFSALENGNLIISNNVFTDSRQTEFHPEATALGTKSELDSTIRFHGNIVGFISCEKTDHYHDWSSDEANFMANMADFYSQALLNDKLITAKRDAEQATRQKSAFLANMSHEIRTPMNGILGMTNILLDEEIPASQRFQLESIRSSGNALLSLINDILDISKIEAGELSIENQDFDLIALIDDIALFIGMAADKKQLDFQLDLANNTPRFINSDPYRLRQILNNLLSNAIKFTHHGSITLRCHCQQLSDTQLTVNFEITDTGIGFEQSRVNYLFKDFTQADISTAREYGGTGLGLNISQQLCRLLGGSISASSQPEQGTKLVFTITAGSALGGLANTADPINSTAAPIDTHAHSILVAEDNEVNTLVISATLKKLGYRFDVVDNGQRALDAITAKHYDLILMDCQMPTMDGLTATRHIRSRNDNNADIKIIALTANAMDSDRETCLAAGMNDYISKPFKPDDLKKILERILQCG